MSVQKNTPNFLKHNGLSFTTIINQTMDLIIDNGALGVYCYLASKSENWNICNVHLQNRFRKGRDHIKKMMNMLKEAGLIRKEAIKDDKGKILYWETTLLNIAPVHNTENPYSGEKLSTIHNTENPACGESRRLEKPPLLNKRSLPIKEKAKIKEREKEIFTLSDELRYNFNEEEKELAKETGLDINWIFEKFLNNRKEKKKKKFSREDVKVWFNREVEFNKKNGTRANSKSVAKRLVEQRRDQPLFSNVKRSDPQKASGYLDEIRQKCGLGRRID